jgi:hypothetical protein
MKDKKEASSYQEFNPLMLLFEVAGKLDPWGVESSLGDFLSETTESETTGLNDETSESVNSNILLTSSLKTANMESLLEQPLPNPNVLEPRYACHPYPSRTQEPTYSTEIRLRVDTVGNKVSEEVYERAPVSEGDSEADVDNSQLWGVVGAPSVHSSVENSSERMISVYDVSNSRLSFSESSKRSETSDKFVLQESFQTKETEPSTNDNVFQDDGLLSEEFRVPRDLHIRTNDGESYLDAEEELFPRNEAKGLWKAVCCNVGNKNCKSRDRVNHLRKEDAAAVFPTTRMISNGKSRSITGQKADLVNGIMGVPSGHFEESKGPQSLYAYDYESNEHMDVFYQDVNQKPRASISVRTLGAPPSISPSTLVESIVVQIEVGRRSALRILE